MNQKKSRTVINESITRGLVYFFLFLVASSTINAQTFTVKKGEWNYNKMMSMAIGAKRCKEDIDTSEMKKKFAKNKIVSYSKCKVELQKLDGEEKTDFLFFAVLLTSTDSVIVICDKNRDGFFSDDSVYWFPVKTDEHNIEAGLGNIVADSIPLKNASGDLLYVKADFYVKPAVRNNNGKYTLEKYPLSFYVKNYSALQFEVNNGKYEMAIFSHPVTQTFYTTYNLYWNENKLIYSIFKLNESGRDSTIAVFRSLTDLTIDSIEYPLIVDGKSIRIADHNSEFTTLSLEFRDTTLTPKDVAGTLGLDGLNIKNLKKEKPFYDTTKIKLIVFGGSWCIPCKEAIPALKKLYTSYSKEIEIIEVLMEKTLSNAEKYVEQNEIPWTTYYEVLNDTSKSPIQYYFNVNIYPSFFILDKNNNIILANTSSEGVKELETTIINLIH